MQIDNGGGDRLPTSVASREKMAPHVPKAKKVLRERGATDLLEMLLGEDAFNGRVGEA